MSFLSVCSVQRVLKRRFYRKKKRTETFPIFPKISTIKKKEKFSKWKLRLNLIPTSSRGRKKGKYYGCGKSNFSASLQRIFRGPMENHVNEEHVERIISVDLKGGERRVTSEDKRANDTRGRKRAGNV